MTPEEDPAKKRVTEALRRWIVANNALRANPESCLSSPPPPETTPEGKLYAEQVSVFKSAEAELWYETDMEYSDDPFRDAAWEWRHWKVLVRKCSWYCLHDRSSLAALAMSTYSKAEARLVDVCGLTSIYRSACEHLEEHFPGLAANPTT